MFTFTAEAVIFAIHSAIRLSAQLRKAYANTLKTRALVLPLPTFDGTPKLSTAHKFFRNNGKEFLEKIAHLAKLHDLVDRKHEDELSDEIKRDYLEYYKAYWHVLNGRWHSFSADDLNHLLLIRQWETGREPVTSPLQIVAGTLVEIGIDFFAQVPGAVHPNSVMGKFLKAFLSGIDEVDFAEGGDLKATLVHQIVPQMFVASAETIGNLSDEITDDPKLQKYIKAASFGLTEDMHRRIAAMSTDGEQQEIIRWGQLIFRSMVRNSSQYIFTNPNEAIGTGIKESELVKSIGEALMGIMLDEDPNSAIKFRDIFSIEALDKIVQSALVVVAEYPSLIANKNGLKEIIAGIANALAESGINRPALLPELVQLVMLQTAGNLEDLLNTSSGATKHLLVTALQPILTILAPKNIHAHWQPHLSNADILAIINDVFDEIVQHPEWITTSLHNQSLLGEVLQATYAALANIPKGNRLNGDTLQILIQINLRTAAANKNVLSKIKWGNGNEETTILNHALSLIFAFSFEQTSLLNKVAIMFELTDFVLDIIISKHPDANGLLLTQIILQEEFGVIQNNDFDKSTANLLVKTALKVIAENPDLAGNNEGLANIISGVARAFQTSGFHHPNLLTELLRLTLEHTSGNIHLLVPSAIGEPKHLLVVALEEILGVLSRPVPTGKWKPSFNQAEILALVEMLLEEVVQNPGWILQKVNQRPLMTEVLAANFNALENIPSHQRISPSVLQMLIELSLHTTAANSQVLSLIKWGSGAEETTVLNKALELVFTYVFSNTHTGDPSALLLDLVDYVLDLLIAKYPNEIGLSLAMIILSDEIGLLLTKGGLDRPKADELVHTALIAIAQHPELVSDELGIQHIVKGVAATLRDSKLSLSEMLPEFVRLTLEKTAGNLNMLINNRRKQKFILILALQQTLKAISQSPSSGKWKPRLTGVQIHEITTLIFEQILQNPELVKDDFVRILLNSVFEALESVPNSKPIPYTVFKSILNDVFDAVNFRKQWIVEIITPEGGSKKLAIEYSLEGLFIELYNKENGTIGTWSLTQGPTLEAIVHAFLIRISNRTINQAEIDEAIGMVKQAVQDLNENKAFILEDLLGRLSSF